MTKKLEKKIDEEVLLILMNDLRDDIIDRYHTEEYWDKQIIEDAAENEDVSVENLMKAFYEYWGRRSRE